MAIGATPKIDAIMNAILKTCVFPKPKCAINPITIKITLISGILIVIGFIAHFGFGNTQVFNIAFIIASILGVAPIAIQAFGALKVKVISIDVLVTIAVIGAFLIQNYEE